ncbi:hypothetical protein MTsDn5_08220 [Alteromonas gracilis]
MYAVEFFSVSLILGCFAMIKLYRYFTSESRSASDCESGVKSAEQLLDMYEAIYNVKSDTQMHQLSEWRKLALQNCEARRVSRVRMSKISGVSFLDDYRSSPRVEGRTH